MKRHRNDGLHSAADELEQVLAEAFEDPGFERINRDAAATYRVLSLLLHDPNTYSPGFSHDVADAQVREQLAPATIDRLLAAGIQLRELVAKVASPTYLAASYWSPIDRQRHTFFSRPHPATCEELRSVVENAYAFYALTLGGNTCGLFSTTQFIATAARRRLSARVSYATGEPEAGALEPWHIPQQSHDALLAESGLLDAIRNALSSQSTDSLQQHLHSTLENPDKERWQDVARMATVFLDSVPRRVGGLSGTTRQVIRVAQEYATRHFDTGVSDEQAWFMALTNVLWQRVCPSLEYYTFVIRLASPCSIMTLGTRQVLADGQLVALARVFALLFSRPLLLDLEFRRAEETVRAQRGGFWRDVSLRLHHRIGNPAGLTRTALSNLELVLRGTTIDGVDRVLGALRSSNDKILQILRELRDYLDEKPLEIMPVELRALLASLAEDCRNVGFRTAVECTSDVIVYANALRLTECLHELLLNADRWCPKQPRSIRLVALVIDKKDVPFKLDADRGFVKLVFSDDGPGVSPDIRERLFEPFISRHPNGTGLGLAIARRDLERIGGTIELATSDAGATFEMFLPMADATVIHTK